MSVHALACENQMESTYISDFLKYKARHNVFFRRKLHQLDELRDLSSDDLQEKANRRFLKLFKLAIRNSRFYSALYAEHGVVENDIRSIDDINILPIITKVDIRDRIDEILIGSKLGVFKGYTSGTSGSPLTVYRHFDSIISENAYLWQYRMSNGLRPKDSKVIIRGDLNKEILFHRDLASNSIYVSAYNLNKENLPKIMQLIRENSPKAIIGYPSSVFILANEFESADIECEIPLGFTSSETLYSYQRERCENIFGMKIFDWYGNSERTIALAQCGARKYHEPPLYGIAEYLDDKIISTSLINTRFPLIRYQVDDRVELDGNLDCGCGTKGRTITNVYGRSDDLIVLPDGTKIGSPGLSTSFKNVEGIRYAQLVQEDVDRIQLMMVVDESFEEHHENLLISNLRSRLGETVSISAQYIDETQLLRNRRGKYQLVVNKLT